MSHKNINIIILERQFNHCLKALITESFGSQGLLTEGDSRINKVRNVIMPRCFHGLLDLDETVTSPEYQVHNNPNTTWGDYLLFNLRHTFGLMGNSDVPLVLYIAPIAWSDEVGLDKRNDNNAEIDELTKICQLFKQEPNLFIKAKNTCPDYERLYQLCEPILQQMKFEANERINSANYKANKQYSIIKDVDFDQAHKIGDYSSLQDGSTCLCYTQDVNIWKSWTKNGENTAFVCLKDGWQEMEPKPGPNAPYDDYGLSMIFVFVNPKGELVASNTRWNHHNAGDTNVDHAFTEEEISNIIGIRFQDAFKPVNPEDRIAGEKQKYLALSKAFMQIVTSSDEWRRSYDRAFPRTLFRFTPDVLMVRYKGYYNVYNLKTQTLSSPEQWYDDWFDVDVYGDEEEEYTYIHLSTDKHTFSLYNPQGQPIVENMQGQLCSKVFHCGYVIVDKSENQCNYIGLDGKILFPDMDFTMCMTFDETTQLASVAKFVDGYKYNFATTDGQFLFDNWANDVLKIGEYFIATNDYSQNLYNSMTKKKFFPEDVDEIAYDSSQGCMTIENNGKFNIIDAKTMSLYSPQQWFDDLENTGYRTFQISLNGQTQTINLDEQ